MDGNGYQSLKTVERINYKASVSMKSINNETVIIIIVIIFVIMIAVIIVTGCFLVIFSSIKKNNYSK